MKKILVIVLLTSFSALQAMRPGSPQQSSESPARSQATSPADSCYTPEVKSFRSITLDTDAPGRSTPSPLCMTPASPASPFTVTLEHITSPKPVVIKAAQPDILAQSFDEKEYAILANHFSNTVINEQNETTKITIIEIFIKLHELCNFAHEAIPKEPWNTHDAERFDRSVSAVFGYVDREWDRTPAERSVIITIIDKVLTLALCVKIGCWSSEVLDWDPSFLFTWTVQKIPVTEFTSTLEAYKTKSSKQYVFHKTPAYNYACLREIHGFTNALTRLKPFTDINERRHAAYMEKFRKNYPDWKPSL